MSERPRSGPRVFRADDPALRAAPAPGSIEDDPTLPSAPPPPLKRRGSALAALFWSALLGLIGLALSVAAYDFITGLIATNIWLGRFALGLLGVVGAGLLIFALREVAALARIGKVDDLRRTALEGWERHDRARADAARSGMEALYKARPELDTARARIREREGDAPDADALLTLVERELLEDLDEAALAPVRRAARSVAAATALLPVGLLDAAAVLYFNVRMIREVAAVYGGRAGWIGSWRLMKQVATHLAATGAIALGDDLIGAVVGGGALAKLSRRAGEGLMNGALTARIGVAAMEVSRPMPFRALPRPSVRGVAKTALRGWSASQPDYEAK